MILGKKAIGPLIGPLGLLLIVITILVLIFMLPGMLIFIKWMFSPGPVVGPIGLFLIFIFVILYLRRQVS